MLRDFLIAIVAIFVGMAIVGHLDYQEDQKNEAKLAKSSDSYSNVRYNKSSTSNKDTK